MKDRLRAHFAAHRDRYEAEILDLLRQLVAERTVNAGISLIESVFGKGILGQQFAAPATAAAS